MRRRLAIGLVPILLATMAVLAVPAQVLAAAEVVETGVTTYKVNVDKSEIDVTIQLSITNNKKPVKVTCYTYYTCTQEYYWNQAYVSVETEAANVKGTSNAGKIKMSVTKTTNYYRTYLVTYPNVYYRQTRVVTVTYALPAAPRAKGGYRATKAYVELCALGNGIDSGKVSVLVPSGYDVSFYAGKSMTSSGEASGFQTFTTGTISAPYDFWSCLEAEKPSALNSATVTSGSQIFDVQAWPEDSDWATTVGADVASYSRKLEDLTGLKMPGGTVTIQEAGVSQLGEYVGGYNTTTKVAAIAEDTDEATIAHELSHIWFNKSLFVSTWTNEGLAGYSEKVAGEGNYKPCTDPGVAPGGATLTSWRYLDVNSTAADEQAVDWQYSASCYLITTIADAVGPDNFKAILVAAANGEIPYVGAGPAEKSPAGTSALTTRALLDLVDERGMIPAGVTDLDQAQKLFASYEVITSSNLSGRSEARAAYHALAISAGVWKLPFAIRSPMATWDFDKATAAMDTATQILALREQIAKTVDGVSLDGSAVQTQFESAQTQADLDAALALARSEADAATKVAEAISLNDGSRTVFQTVGLIGSDPASLVSQAVDELKQLQPDQATASAQSAIDMINRSGDQGMIRLGAVLGVFLALILLIVFLLLFRRYRRKRAALALAAAAAPVAPPDASLGESVWTPPVGTDVGTWSEAAAGVAPPAEALAPAEAGPAVETSAQSEPATAAEPPAVEGAPAAPPPPAEPTA